MVSASDGDPGSCIEKMSLLLRKIKDFVLTENPDIGDGTNSKLLSINVPERIASDANPKSPIIPDDFRCPISLELMKNPVIVSTGQVVSLFSDPPESSKKFKHMFSLTVFF